MKLFQPILLLLTLVISPVSLAKDDARAEAERLLDIVDMQASFAALTEATVQRYLATNPGIKQFEPVMRAYVDKQMGYAGLKDELVAMYTAEFTAKELREIAKFYSTSTGRKAIAKLPGILNKAAELGNRRVRENTPELEAMINAEAERIRDRVRAAGSGKTILGGAGKAETNAETKAEAEAKVDAQPEPDAAAKTEGE